MEQIKIIPLLMQTNKNDSLNEIYDFQEKIKY